MTDNLYAVRNFRKRLRQGKPPEIELEPGDMLVNTETDQACLVINVTSRAETLKAVVQLYSSKMGGHGTMTLDSVKSKCKQGLMKVVKKRDAEIKDEG